MKIEAIIFDKDGTLIDFDAFWVKVTEKAMKKVLDELGVTRVNLTEMLAILGVKDGISDIDGLLCGGTNREIGERLFALFTKHGYNFDKETVCKIVDEAFISSTDAGELRPTTPYLCDVLKSLKARGIKLAVITNDIDVITRKCLSAIGILDLFDIIYTDDGKSPTKPDPYFANALCDKEGLDKEHVLMVGDTMTDVNFARNAGIKVACLAKTKEAREKMRAVADFVIPDPSHIKDIID